MPARTINPPPPFFPSSFRFPSLRGNPYYRVACLLLFSFHILPIFLYPIFVLWAFMFTSYEAFVIVIIIIIYICLWMYVRRDQ